MAPDNTQRISAKKKEWIKPEAIVGDGDSKREVAVPIIWDNFSIFRTNCAIACRTRAYMM